MKDTSLLLETADSVMPFSLGMLLELLLGELGPEPGALLHAESGREERRNPVKKTHRCWSMCVRVSGPHPPCPGSASWRW